MVIEGSAAAGVAAAAAGRIAHKRFAVVLTGSNIDASRLAALLA
jgi:threonine dehydratase